MTFLEQIGRAFQRKKETPAKKKQYPKLVMTADCLRALSTGLSPYQNANHEGIAYLLGRTDGEVSIATMVFMPKASTTPGSFFVDQAAMGECIMAAYQDELQIVCQVHTHPKQAYHSDGDVDGMKIRFPGLVSMVLPEYGSHLPNLKGNATFMWTRNEEWQELGERDLKILGGAGPWTGPSGKRSGTTGRSATQSGS